MTATKDSAPSAHSHTHSTCCHSPLGSIPKLPANQAATEDSHAASQVQPIAAMAPAMLLGEVCAEHDSKIDSRALIEYRDQNGTCSRVMASIATGISVYPGDKVLFVIPANALIAVVTTVLARSNSLRCPPPNQSQSADSEDQTNDQAIGNCSQLVLHDTDALQVTTAAGQTLVAIERGACGPIVRLGQGALALEVPGEFHLVADSVNFSSRRGPVQINSATDDVIVKGRTIRLN